MSICTRSATNSTTSNYYNSNNNNQTNIVNKRRKQQTQSTFTTNTSLATIGLKSKPKYNKNKKANNNRKKNNRKNKQVLQRKMLSSLENSTANNNNQQNINKMNNKFNYRHQKSKSIKIPAAKQQQTQNQYQPYPNQQINQFSRQTSMSNQIGQPSMSLPSPTFANFQFNPTVVAAAAATLANFLRSEMSSNLNKESMQFQQQSSANVSSNRPNNRYSASNANNHFNIDNNNNHLSYFNNNLNSNFINQNYNHNQNNFKSSSYTTQTGGFFPKHLQNQYQQQQNKPYQQLHQHNHNTRYSARFKYGRPNGSQGKNTAPYNTTQYIMQDYNKRNPLDQECPNEQQQFSDEWNMALATNSNSSNSSVINLDFSKENNDNKSTDYKLENSSLSTTESTSEQMSIDEDKMVTSNEFKLSSSI